VSYALAIVNTWEDARQQVAVPRGRARVVRVGAEASLWNPLIADWLVWMARECPDVAVRVEIEGAERLIENVQQGAMDLAVIYGPPQRPNLIAELLADEKLVMVTTVVGGRWRADSYVHVDWGSAFTASVRAAYPEVGSPAISTSLGPLALNYILRIGGSGYFRAGAVRKALAEKKLFKVPNAPEFSHSVYAVYTAGNHAAVMERVRAGLQAAASVRSSPGAA
jgi:DNA-binding transcriptional LysR family regulator